MKLIKKSLILLAFSATANACMADGGETYLSIKTGVTTVITDSSDIRTHSGTFGIGHIFKDFGNGIFAVEAEAGGFTSHKEELPDRVSHFAVYGVGRTKGRFYGKIKAGALYEIVNRSLGQETISESDTGLSIGVGAGFHITDNLDFEFESTAIEESVVYSSFGLNFRF